MPKKEKRVRLSVVLPGVGSIAVYLPAEQAIVKRRLLALVAKSDGDTLSKCARRVIARALGMKATQGVPAAILARAKRQRTTPAKVLQALLIGCLGREAGCDA